MSARLFKQSENVAAISYAELVARGGDLVAQAATPAAHPPLPSHASSLFSESVLKESRIPEGSHLVAMRDEAELLSQSRAEAVLIIAEAEARAASVEREARERGMAESSAQAAAEASRMVEPLLQKLAQTIDEVAQLRSNVFERVEHDLLRLALEIARKVVQREVTVDREIALALTRVALSKLHHRALATVRLHPEDCAYVSANCARLGTGSAVEIVEDHTVARGGCLVETEMGDVDARIEQQFAEIERGFFEA